MDSNKFEDNFMDLQSEFISLCLELTEQKVDKIYAYCSIEAKSRMFNAFFEVGGEIKTANQLGINNSLVNQFLRVGTHDLPKFSQLCESYGVPTPTEIKMQYDTESGKFDAAYKYDVVCSETTGISAGEVFMNWFDEIKKLSRK